MEAKRNEQNGKNHESSSCYNAYVAFKNTGDCPVYINDACINYEDDNGRLLATDKNAKCIPQAVKPGQIGYVYSYYEDLLGADLTNGIRVEPDGDVIEATGFYEIDVSDVSASTSGYGTVKVIGRGTNNTDSAREYAEPGAVFFGKDGSIMGFCYGWESFDIGQTKSFEISGEMMSEDCKEEDLDHVEVYIQGYSWF